MWRVVKVCPKCLCGEFEKNEHGEYVCIECEEVYDDMDDLENMDFEE